VRRARLAKRMRGDARRARLRDRLTTGLSALESGASYPEAAYRAGYSDEFAFSRTCKSRLGARPRALLAQDWRRLVDERTRTQWLAA
jgi:AraC-like DNA-binding protein